MARRENSAYLLPAPPLYSLLPRQLLHFGKLSLRWQFLGGWGQGAFTFLTREFPMPLRQWDAPHYCMPTTLHIHLHFYLSQQPQRGRYHYPPFTGEECYLNTEQWFKWKLYRNSIWRKGREKWAWRYRQAKSSSTIARSWQRILICPETEDMHVN